MKDFTYHEIFLKEPELTIILKILQYSDDIKLIKSIIIIMTNICTNRAMIDKLISKNLLDIFIKFIKREVKIFNLIYQNYLRLKLQNFLDIYQNHLLD